MTYFEKDIYQTILKNDESFLLEKIGQDKRVADEILISAIKNKHVKIVKILLNNDFNFNKKDENGWLPLHHAAFIGEDDIYKIILSKTKKPNRGAGFNKNTAAHIAVENGHISIVQIMISKQINITHCNALLQSPLHLAVRSGQYEIVQILLEAGCDPNQSDKSGQTPITMTMNEITACEEAMKCITSDELVIKYNLNKQILNILIACNIDLHLSGSNDDNNLILATKNHQTDVVEILIKNGMSPDIVDIDGWTPMHHAAFLGHEDLISIFLKTTVDVNKSTRIEKSNILHLSAYAGHLKIVKLILPHITDLNSKNHDLKTALHLSVEENYPDVALELIKAGADIHIENPNGENIQILAEQRKQRDLLCALFSGGSTYYLNIFKKIENKQIDHFKKLMECGYNVNELNFQRQNLLIYACIHNVIEIVEYLIEKGCLLNESDNENMSALHHAVKNGFEDIVKTLLKYRTNPDYRDCEYRTPLFYAPTVEILQMLIDKNTNINIVDEHSCNALSMAVFSNRTEVAIKLLELDCPILDEDKLLYTSVENNNEQLLLTLINKSKCLAISGKPALQYAKSNSLKNLENILASNGVVDEIEKCPNKETEVFNDWTSLHSAIQQDDVENLILLLKTVLDINARTDSGNTSVHIAAENGNSRSLDILAKNGANLNEINDNGMTPLQIASNASHDKFVILLLELGADLQSAVNTVNCDGITPLHICAQHNKPNLVKYLLQNGDNPNKTDNNGIAPIHLAAIDGHIEIVDVLLKFGADLNIKDIKRKTALKYSILNSHHDVALKLVDAGAKYDDVSEDELNRLLVDLQETKNFKIFKYFMKNIENLQKTFEKGTFSYNMCENVKANYFLASVEKNSKDLENPCTSQQINVDNEEILKNLFENKLNVNVQDLRGENLIMRCLIDDNLEALKVLLENKIQIRNENIFQAIQLQKMESIKILIKHIDINNLYNENGYTPLIFAAKLGHHSIVDLLIKKGANVHLKNITTNYNILHEIIEYLDDTDTFFNVFMVIKNYLSDLNLTYPNGDTLLCRAITLNRTIPAALLIQYGVCVNVTSLKYDDEERNKTVLNMAIEKKMESVIYLLIVAGAKLPENWYLGCFPLSYLSRLSIRNCILPNNIKEFLNSFNIPIQMKKFLLIQDNSFSRDGDYNYEDLLKNIIINKIKSKSDTNP